MPPSPISSWLLCPLPRVLLVHYSPKFQGEKKKKKHSGVGDVFLCIRSFLFLNKLRVLASFVNTIVMGSIKIDVFSKQMNCSGPLWKVGKSIYNISGRPRSLCKISVVLKSPGFHRVQCCRNGKFVAKAVLEEKKILINPDRSLKSYNNGLPSQQIQMGLSDSSLESTVAHRIWVGVGCGAMVGMLIKTVIAMDSMESVLIGLLCAFLGYVFADMGTGIYHWGIDNYGDANTPIFGSQIDAFQGHHRRPWTITKRQFANNIHALARPASLILGAFILLPSNTGFDAFAGVMTGCIVFSQQFHCWSHCKKSQLPALVIGLQDKGVLVSRVKHGAHHRAPYDNNYCIVSGMWNPLLDSTKFFRKMEMLIYSRWGVRPRCWDETAAEWLQDGSYFADGSNL
eukprot:Gb_03374 [translate_table: standard]